MRKLHRDYLAACMAAGLHPREIEYRGKHFAVVCEEGRVFCPSTPSDWRTMRNVRSAARKLVV